MPSQRRSKVIIDTNIWVSFLIGKELHRLKDLITHDKIKIVLTDQIIRELRIVTSREKLKKYFDPLKVEELISLLEIISIKVTIKKIKAVCRDPKDDFLLALAAQSKAAFLVTGDKDLLELKYYEQTKIVSAKDFSRQFGPG